MGSDSSHSDRVREELARRAEEEHRRAALRAQAEAEERAYFRRLNAARSELPDMLRRAALGATEFPVEIERIIPSEASSDDLEADWEEGDEEGWEEEGAVEIAFYKLRFDEVIRESVAEVSIPTMWPTHGSDEPRAVVLDTRASDSSYVEPGTRSLEHAVSRAIDLVVNALADAIEAGCEIIPPAEGRRRIDEQDAKQRLAEQALVGPDTAPPSVQREAVSPWVWGLALVGLILSIIFRLG